jgi:superfamily II DNA/RNA helicase
VNGCSEVILSLTWKSGIHTMLRNSFRTILHVQTIIVASSYRRVIPSFARHVVRWNSIGVDNPLLQNNFSTLEICEYSKKAINDILKYSTMTRVQSESVPVILKGNDCLVKAKTGTGNSVIVRY